MSPIPPRDLAAEVERIFFEQGWPLPESLDDWDDHSLEALEQRLDPESYQTLLDELMETEES